MSYVDDLLKMMITDKQKTNTYDRYPIRFIFSRMSSNALAEIMELYDKYVNAAKKYSNLLNSLEVIKLSSLLAFDDAWITKQEVYDKICSLEPNKDYLILGFSELARFYSKSDLQSLIMSFMTDIESESRTTKQRIYFVCFSLFDKLTEVLKINGRNANINPIICPPEFVDSDSICVYYANSSFGTNTLNSNTIKNTSEWLSLYEAKNVDFGKGIVCLSDTLVSIYEKAKPDNFVEIYKIDSYFSLLVRMLGFDISNKDDTKFTNEFWKRVYELSSKYSSTSIKNICFRYLKTNVISSDNFVDLFYKTDLFGKQLMHLYLEENANDIMYSYYINEVLNKTHSNSYSSFSSFIVTEFDNLYDSAHFDARKYYINKLFELKIINREFNQDALLKSLNACFNSFLMGQILISNLQQEDLLELNNTTLIFKYHQDPSYVNKVMSLFYSRILSKAVTGLFKIEQYVVMNLLSNWYLTVEEAISIYPELRKYLGAPYNQFINSTKYWISEYIYEYKLSKMVSKGTDKFVSFSKSNTEEQMYKWYFDSSILHQQDMIDANKYDKLIVIDGVGIEYFDYVIEVIKENGKFINYADYAKSFIPSITSINKENMSGYDKWITDFDRLRIHGELYNNIKTIPDSLSFLNEMIIKIIKDNPGSIVCITADHGCTCQSKILETTKKYDFKNADHENRCMEITGSISTIAKSNDYTIYQDVRNGKNYLISLNNYSLDSKPLRECHGGATIEECFVPCIVFSDNAEFKNYSVRAIKSTINGLDKKIAIEITPRPSSAPLYFEENGTQGVFKLEKENLWTTDVSVVSTQILKVVIGDYTTHVDVVSSSGISKKGDDGFDD